MPKYEITALYEYSTEIEADNPEQAEKYFLQDLNAYYVSTESFEIEELEEDEDEDGEDN